MAAISLDVRQTANLARMLETGRSLAIPRLPFRDPESGEVFG